MTTPRNRCLVAVAALVAGLLVNAWAKCATDSVEIRGQVQCSFKPDYKVLVTLLFKKNQLEGFGEEAALDLRDDSFQGRIKFDTFTSYNPLWGHRCNRRPISVLVRLISAEGEEQDRKMLSVRDDFIYDEKDGLYELRSPLVLHGWCNPCTSTAGRNCH
jgi:hypothetical protein